MRKFAPPKPLATLTVIASVCITSFVVINACRKMDRVVKDPETKNHEQRFFNDHASPDLTVRAIAAFMKGENERFHFLDRYIDLVGFPIWDKAKKYTVRNRSASRLSLDDGKSKTVYFIPFVRDGGTRVAAALRVTMTGRDTLYKLLIDNQYRDTLKTGMKPRHLTLLLMQLDQEAYGHKKFEITDPSVIDRPGTYDNKITINSASDISSAPAPGRLTVWEYTLTVCTTETGWGYPDGQVHGCAPPDCPYYEETTCDSITWYEWEDDGGGGGGHGGGGEPGGGGGGGGGGSTEPPCSGLPGGGLFGRLLPCDDGDDPTPPGWGPVVDIDDPVEDSCAIAHNAAKRLDTVYAQGKADSVLSTIPGLATEPLEKGFPIYRKFTVNPQDPTDTTFTNIFKPGDVQTGSATQITISANIPYLHVYAAMLHTHPPGGYTAHSAYDIFTFIEARMTGPHFEGSFVAAYDGSRYAITISNYAQAVAFDSLKSQYLDSATHGWKVNSDIGKAFEKARKYFLGKFKGDPKQPNLAYEMAMAAVLDQFGVGVTLNKQDVAGNFKPIIVKTSPDPRKPNRTVYTQECI